MILPKPEPGVMQPPAAPSYAPFMLALGVMMILWGIVTSPIMSIGGFVMLAWALGMWISAIAHGWRK